MNRGAVVRQSPNKFPFCCHFFLHLQNKTTSAKLPKKLGQHMWVFDSNKWDSYLPSYPSSYLAQAVKVTPKSLQNFGPFWDQKTPTFWSRKPTYFGQAWGLHHCGGVLKFGDSLCLKIASVNTQICDLFRGPTLCTFEVDNRHTVERNGCWSTLILRFVYESLCATSRMTTSYCNSSLPQGRSL